LFEQRRKSLRRSISFSFNLSIAQAVPTYEAYKNQWLKEFLQLRNIVNYEFP
jgi:hypothetical protein